MSIKDRIQQYLDYKGIKPGSLEKAANLSNGYWRKTKSISAEVASNILRLYSELSAEWVLFERGAMLVEPEDTPVINYNTDKKGRPYYNVDFTGGFSVFLDNKTALPEYYIDFEPYNGIDCLWCNLSGRSMEPAIMAGDKIAIKQVRLSDVIYGKIYAIVTRSGMRTVKHIVRADNPDYIRLVPENKDPMFGDYQDISISDIMNIFEVLASVRVFQ